MRDHIDLPTDAPAIFGPPTGQRLARLNRRRALDALARRKAAGLLPERPVCPFLVDRIDREAANRRGLSQPTEGEVN